MLSVGYPTFNRESLLRTISKIQWNESQPPHRSVGFFEWKPEVRQFPAYVRGLRGDQADGVEVRWFFVVLIMFLSKLGRCGRYSNTRWWFHVFCLFSSLFGEDFQFDSYFPNGLKPPTTRVGWGWRFVVFFYPIIGSMWRTVSLPTFTEKNEATMEVNYGIMEHSGYVCSKEKVWERSQSVPNVLFWWDMWPFPEGYHFWFCLNWSQ